MDNREPLRSYLARHASNPDVCPAVMRTLEPYFAHAETRRFTLKRAADIPLQQAIDTIADVTGAPVNRLVFIECSRFDHVTNYEEKEIWRRLAYDAGDDLCDCLRIRFPDAGSEDRGGRADPDDDPLPRVAERHLLGAVDIAIDAAAPSPSQTVMERVKQGVRYAIRAYLRSAVLDDQKSFRRLASLVTLASLVLPIQFSIREKASFVLFSA